MNQERLAWFHCFLYSQSPRKYLVEMYHCWGISQAHTLNVMFLLVCGGGKWVIHGRRGRVTSEVVALLKEELAGIQPNNSNLSPASDSTLGRKVRKMSPEPFLIQPVKSSEGK